MCGSSSGVHSTVPSACPTGDAAQGKKRLSRGLIRAIFTSVGRHLGNVGIDGLNRGKTKMNKLSISLMAIALSIFALPNYAAAQNTDLVLRCDRPGFPNDFKYIGINSQRTRVDFIAYSGRGLWLNGSALNVPMRQETHRFLVDVGLDRWSIDRTSLRATEIRYNISRYDCAIEPNAARLEAAVQKYNQKRINRENERRQQEQQSLQQRRI